MKKLIATIHFKGMGILKDQYELVQTMIYGKWYKHLKEAKEKGNIKNFIILQEDGKINLEIITENEEEAKIWNKNLKKLGKRFNPLGRMFKLLKITTESKLEDMENNSQEQKPNHS